MNSSIQDAMPTSLIDHQNEILWKPKLAKRKKVTFCFFILTALMTLLALFTLGFLITSIAGEGLHRINMTFIESFPSRFPDKAGIKSALFGSLWLISLTALIAIPIGIGASIYLEEFSKNSRLRRFIDLNISNLAGVPSIVYGLLGLVIFVRFMALDRSVLAGALTMSLLILPVIIVAAREALKAVPSTIRHAAYALGATKWQTIKSHIMPSALPGMLTGIILALSRAIGETAPLIMVGALTYIAFTPEGPMDAFTALPIQIFNWTSRPQEAFHELAAGGIIVLLAVLLITNSFAVFLRHRYQRNLKW